MAEEIPGSFEHFEKNVPLNYVSKTKKQFIYLLMNVGNTKWSELLNACLSNTKTNNVLLDNILSSVNEYRIQNNVYRSREHWENVYKVVNELCEKINNKNGLNKNPLGVVLDSFQNAKVKECINSIFPQDSNARNLKTITSFYVTLCQEDLKHLNLIDYRETHKIPIKNRLNIQTLLNEISNNEKDKSKLDVNFIKTFYSLLPDI